MTATGERIGFMQGRLSALVEGKIQAFPWSEWREEFPRARALGLSRMEWTIDQDRLRENPLTTDAGRTEIKRLVRENALGIPSLTGDCFMQAPFWKATGQAREALLADLDLVLASCSALGIEFVVIPLVDNGKIETPDQTQALLGTLLTRTVSLSKQNVKIVFESDLLSSPGFRPRISASITTSATALRLAMIAAKKSQPTRRAFSTSMSRTACAAGPPCRSAPVRRSSPGRSG
jgi:L-ribulose-5-phosphate 3-epimerase